MPSQWNRGLPSLGPVTIPAHIAQLVRQVRREVSELHAHLPRNQLVVWTAGNVSPRVPGHDLLVIKPSGVGYGGADAPRPS